MKLNTSAISVCSAALLELGSRPINDFDENTEGARLCANLWPILRDNMLRLHPWNFAKKRVKLSPTKDIPEFGYSFAFNVPADFLRVISVNGEYAKGMAWPEGYTLENGQILSDVPSLHLQYVYRNEEPINWDSEFTRLMVLTMKKSLAYPVTRDNAVKNDAEQEWAIALRLAKSTNGIETQPNEFGGDAFLKARY